ncbi:MAG: indolepyruvate ferredoxin oxidoreductase, partial [Deltaproteobacteria bacterium]|nr:indolepyruvate ferredoxin oxidoreductase [Deltaproteobacteria bacterium]
NVRTGKLPPTDNHAEFRYNGFLLDPMEGLVSSAPVVFRHMEQQGKIKKVREMFEESPYNTYEGPEKPELLIITSSACTLYSREAIQLLGLKERVGILKIGTTWPLPPRLLTKYLAVTDQILIVEEVLPFLEENVKVIAAEQAKGIGAKTFYGKNDGTLPMAGELNPDFVVGALCKILNMTYVAMPEDYEKKAQLLSFARAPNREQTFCPGCPHRASFWSIHNALQLDNRRGFVCGDIGCYTMAMLPTGFMTLKTVHSMGSGTGIASGFGKLAQFGMDQPVLSVCGDSTFYHAAMPALVNAVHHKSNIIMVVLDNSGTAMTGFQPHPGLTVSAMGDEVPAVDVAGICRAIGARVEIRDPFNLKETQETLNELMEDKEGAKVLILRQKCALSPERKAKKYFEMHVDETRCIGEECGCNRLCTRILRCPGLFWDKDKKTAVIDDVLCAGCGVCSYICPQEAIIRKEVA